MAYYYQSKTILKYKNVNYGVYLYDAITPPPDAPNANVKQQINQEHSQELKSSSSDFEIPTKQVSF